MTWRNKHTIISIWLVLFCVLLPACGGDSTEAPPPTQADSLTDRSAAESQVAADNATAENPTLNPLDSLQNQLSPDSLAAMVNADSLLTDSLRDALPPLADTANVTSPMPAAESGDAAGEQTTQGDQVSGQADSSTDAAAADSSAATDGEGLGGGVLKTLQESSENLDISITFGNIILSLVVILLCVFSLKLITKLLDSIAERFPNWRFGIKRLIPIVRILGWTTAIYFIIAVIFQPPIETVVAFTASASIALGFASQDILKNIFGGIMILFDRPFQVGDKVQIGEHYGEVIQIGMRTVRLVTPDDSVVSVPNGEIMNQSVSNSNVGESNCQVVPELYLPAHIDIAAAKAIAYRACIISRFVYLRKPIVIIVKNENDMGRSVLKFRVKAYVLDIRYEFPFASDLTETIITELIDRGLVDAAELGKLPNPTIESSDKESRLLHVD